MIGKFIVYKSSRSLIAAFSSIISMAHGAQAVPRGKKWINDLLICCNLVDSSIVCNHKLDVGTKCHREPVLNRVCTTQDARLTVVKFMYVPLSTRSATKATRVNCVSLSSIAIDRAAFREKILRYKIGISIMYQVAIDIMYLGQVRLVYANVTQIFENSIYSDTRQV